MAICGNVETYVTAQVSLIPLYGRMDFLLYEDFIRSYTG